MPSALTDASSFDTVTGPIGTDIRNAASVRAALQTVANRTRYLYDRLTPLADFTALKAIAAPANDLLRLVKSQGIYVFDSASALSEQLPYVVAPGAGSGRWLHVDGIPAPTAKRTAPIVPIGLSTAGFVAAAVAPGAETVNTLFVPDAGLFVSAGHFLFAIANSGSSSHWGVLFDLSPFMVDGKTLSSALLRIDPSGGHAGLPQTMPCFGVFRRAHADGSTAKLVSAPANGFVIDSSASVAAYEAAHSIVFTPNQNNVIDRTLYQYYGALFDEGGTNALDGTKYFGVELNF